MKVAIAGYGIEGKVSLNYFKAHGDDVTVLDERSIEASELAGIACKTGSDVFDDLSEYDMVIRTASLRPDRLSMARKVWSATNEFFEKCPAPIIGVTGTKGKGTTASLVAGILKAAGKTVHLVGNIGVPALEVLPNIKADDIVVYELSSFQLWDLEKSPHVAVVLMIEPDHLDVHRDMEEYITAKQQIAAHQAPNDTVIYHPTNPFSRRIASVGEGHKIRYGVVEEGGAYVKENTFFVQTNPICAVDTLQLAGQHNIENACAAISAVWLYTQDVVAIEKGLRDFSGLPHRLKLVADVKSVKYYDDSIATTPGSAIAAIKSFEAPKIVILGGSDKGADYSEIVELCVQTNTKIIAVGQTGGVIHELAISKGADSHRVTGGMSEIVAAAAGLAEAGAVVILSPASASFDQYKSYADRGEQFIAAVNQL